MFQAYFNTLITQAHNQPCMATYNTFYNSSLHLLASKVEWENIGVRIVLPHWCTMNHSESFLFLDMNLSDDWFKSEWTGVFHYNILYLPTILQSHAFRRVDSPPSVFLYWGSTQFPYPFL